MDAPAVSIKNTYACPGWLLLFAFCAGIFPFGLDAQDNPDGTQEALVFMPRLEVVAQRQRDWSYMRTNRIEFLTDMGNTGVAIDMAQALDMAVEHAEFIFPNAGKLREIPIKIVIHEGYAKESDTITYAQLVRNRGKWRHLSDPEQYIIVRPYTKALFGIMNDNFLNGLWVGQALFGGTRSIIMRPLNEWDTRRAYAYNLYLDCVSRALWINDQNRFGNRTQYYQDWIFSMAEGLFGKFERFDLFRNRRVAASDQNKFPGPPARQQYDPKPNITGLRWELGPCIALEEILARPPPHPPLGPGSVSLMKKLGAKRPDSSKRAVHDDPAGAVVTKRIIWQRECLDFGNYCLIAKRDKYGNAWMRFVYAIGRQPPTEELFKECFGMGFEAFHKEMYQYYIKLPDSQAKWEWGPLDYTIDIHKGRPKPAKPAPRPATRAETARILSEAMVFGNSDSPEYARNVLLKAASEMPRTLEDPEFAASLELNEAKHGNRDRAIELLEKATGEKVARASAYRTLAQLRLEKLLARKGNGHSAKLTAQEAASVLDPLLLAHGQRQATGQAYKQMAGLWNHTDCDPPEILFALIAAGCVHFATDLDLLESAVPMLAKYKKKGMIAAILDNSAKWMFSQADKERFQNLVRQFGTNPS
jgi:hypothetical protein